jgi:Lysyl oxidase
MGSRHRSRRLICLVGVAGAVVISSSGTAVAAVDRVPDLGVAQLRDLTVESQSNGTKLLRYTTILANVGAGPFELRASRPNTSSDFTAAQRIYDTAGGYRDVPLPNAKMVWAANPAGFAGDGHNHWHVVDLEKGDLTRLDNGVVHVGSLAKHGFCFYDNVAFRLSLPGAAQNAAYTTGNSCAGGNPSSTEILMGLSVGWGDAYYWNTLWQWVDITGLGNGRYRLDASINASGLGLVESNPSNDNSWAEFTLKGKSLKNITYGGGT